MVDPITESDLAAYVDGQLGALRRVEVEAHLARHPEDAARVMADLRDRDALREAFTAPIGQGAGHMADDMAGQMPDRLRASARRLDRSLAWQRVGARLRRAAVIAVLVGVGWIAHTDIGTFGVPDTYAAPIDPSVVEEAQQARQAVQIRARTHSQAAIPSYDRADLEAATGLSLPAMPADWRVRDVQVFPARLGAGVEVTIDAGPLGDLALFATGRPEALTGSAAGSNVASSTTSNGATRSADGATAFWRSGRTAYALTAGRDGIDVAAAAARLTSRP